MQIKNYFKFRIKNIKILKKKKKNSGSSKWTGNLGASWKSYEVVLKTYMGDADREVLRDGRNIASAILGT